MGMDGDGATLTVVVVGAWVAAAPRLSLRSTWSVVALRSLRGGWCSATSGRLQVASDYAVPWTRLLSQFIPHADTCPP